MTGILVPATVKPCYCPLFFDIRGKLEGLNAYPLCEISRKHNAMCALRTFKMATIKQVSDLLNASKGEDHAPYYSIKGEYHDGEEIYDVIREALDEYNDDEEASEDEISEMLYERADGATPIYYSDIAKWFAENFNAVDEYIDEMGGGLEGAMGGADIMKTIQATYCYMLHRDAMKVLSDLIEQADDEDGLTN